MKSIEKSCLKANDIFSAKKNYVGKRILKLTRSNGGQVTCSKNTLNGIFMPFALLKALQHNHFGHQSII